MKRGNIHFGTVVILFLLFGYSTHAAVLPDPVLASIRDSVFEVVVAKPADDDITYEKPLPLTLIPFSVRNDAYYSIGTAFAIAPNRFVSAAHVFSAHTLTFFGDVFLRDKSGRIYTISKVGKYSTARDFIVFSVSNCSVTNTLVINETPKLHDTVFAVGNAYGEGVIIRDGLLTSMTREEENGAWSFLRFSAAASHGNSGGPLLDREGKIIGIVLRKSENENLNYALPISEVLAAPLTATHHARMKYQIANLTTKAIESCDVTVALPKTLSDLRIEFNSAVMQTNIYHITRLFSGRSEGVFPTAPDAADVIMHENRSTFPLLIAEGSKKQWDSFAPEKRESTALNGSGTVEYGELAGMIFSRVSVPYPYGSTNVINDAKQYNDMLLKGYPMHRIIADERTRIVSLGNPINEQTNTDWYGRRWIVRTFVLMYCDWLAVTYTLPLPNGGATFSLFGPTEYIMQQGVASMALLSSFIHINYYGTFEQWRDFLGCRDILPDALQAVSFTFMPDRNAALTSPGFSVRYGTNVFPVTKNSDLELLMGFSIGSTNVTWDVHGAIFGSDRNARSYFGVRKKVPPPEQASDMFKSDWSNVTAGSKPYNTVPFSEDAGVYIRGLHVGNARSAGTAQKIYVIDVGIIGDEQHTNMIRHFHAVSDSVTITE
ncbi:MAG: trypsin-like peptidase domain-containing protein [Spirochaetes bacterium]|nr:trypsin-like peptidase domain-containing protein [Spirochaetota bacterium]